MVLFDLLYSIKLAVFPMQQQAKMLHVED